MDTKIVERDRLLLAGFSFFGDPFSLAGDWMEENEIGRLWKRFMRYLEERRELLAPLTVDEVAYEVHTYDEETRQTGNFQVFVGREIRRVDELPVELLVKVLPPSLYAVFTLRGVEITSDWPQVIYGEWLPDSGYAPLHAYTFQQYDARFKGMDRIAESVLDVYVPVSPK